MGSESSRGSDARMPAFPADYTELEATDDDSSIPVPASTSETVAELGRGDPVLLVLDGISTWLVD
jgi:hypothetical protein